MNKSACETMRRIKQRLQNSRSGVLDLLFVFTFFLREMKNFSTKPF